MLEGNGIGWVPEDKLCFPPGKDGGSWSQLSISKRAQVASKGDGYSSELIEKEEFLLTLFNDVLVLMSILNTPWNRMPESISTQSSREQRLNGGLAPPEGGSGIISKLYDAGDGVCGCAVMCVDGEEQHTANVDGCGDIGPL